MLLGAAVDVVAEREEGCEEVEEIAVERQEGCEEGCAVATCLEAAAAEAR